MGELVQFEFRDEHEAHENLMLQKMAAAHEAADVMHTTSGGVLAFAGPMESGKSTGLQMTEENLLARGVDPSRIHWFKPEIRFGEVLISNDPTIYVRGNGEVDATLLVSPEQLDEDKLPPGSHAMVDEGQFLPDDVRAAIVDTDWKKRGVHVAVGGLNRWHHGARWQAMHEVMDAADQVFHLNAMCDVEGCHDLAPYTQQLVDGEPNPHGPDVAVRAEDEDVRAEVVMDYDARCPEHHVGIEYDV